MSLLFFRQKTEHWLSSDIIFHLMISSQWSIKQRTGSFLQTASSRHVKQV